MLTLLAFQNIYQQECAQNCMPSDGDAGVAGGIVFLTLCFFAYMQWGNNP